MSDLEGDSRSAPGDRSARRERFVRIADEHVESLIRYARHLLWNPEHADDAVQEALLRAWQYFDSYHEEGGARVWLFAILRRVVYDASARRGRDRARTSLDAPGGESNLPMARPDEDRFVTKDVEEAVARLPDDLREVFVLCVIEQLKYREAAEAIGAPIGTVMSRLFRARQLLRWYLRDYAGEEEAASIRDARQGQPGEGGRRAGEAGLA